MNKSAVLLFLCSLPLASAFAEPAALRPLKPDDAWTYRQLTKRPEKADSIGSVRYVVAMANPKLMVINRAGLEMSKTATPVWQMMGPLPDNTCIFDITAQDTLALKDSCTLDLTDGMAWKGVREDAEQMIKETFMVAPVEEISVPAGRFMAVRIDGERTVSDFVRPRQAAPAEGRNKIVRTTYWYSREVKGMVKVVRETVTPKGKLLQRVSEELETFSGK